jgi:hypothetical protein
MSDIGCPAGDGSFLGAVLIPPVSSLAVTVMAPEVCLEASVVEPSVPERLLGESPPHARESEFSAVPAFDSWLGALNVGRPAGDGSSSGLCRFLR